jgi:hypothetical protein
MVIGDKPVLLPPKWSLGRGSNRLLFLLSLKIVSTEKVARLLLVVGTDATLS